MKHLNLWKSTLLLFALVVGSTSVWATDIESNFTDKNLSVGTGELEWTASHDANSFESSGYARGVQFGAAIGEFTLTSTSLNNITKVVLEVSTNGTASANTIAVKVGGTTDFTTDGSTKTYAMPKSNNYTVTFSGEATNGTIVISFNDTNKSIYVKSITVTYSAEEVVAAPTFSPVAGEVAKGSTVTLTQAAADQIRYTLDGTDPTKSTGSVYSSPIVINEATVIKAIAVKGDKVSDVATAAYSIAYPKVLTLDLTDAGWGFPADGVTDAATYTNNGYTINLGASSTYGHKKIMSGDDIVSLIFGKNGATLTLPAFGFNVSKFKVYGQSGASKDVTFNVYVGDDAVSTEATSSKEEHEFVIVADKQAAGTIYTIKVTNSNNCQISKIEVYGNGCEAGVVTDAGWATYVTTCDMEFAEGDAFVVSAANATTATLTGVTKIRANQPVILKGEGAKTAKVLDEAPAAVSNELAISNGGEIDGFVLAKPAGKSVGFYKWNGGSLTSGKVYLPAPAAARDYLEFSFGGETTTINNLTLMPSRKGEGMVYDLQGRRVAQPTKGLYIVNGKKVFVP